MGNLGCVIQDAFLKEHGAHMILLCSSYMGQNGSVVFHLTQSPLSAERIRSQLTPIMKPKIKLFASHLKIAQSELF